MQINDRPRRPRVGHIDFLNCLPLYWGLMRTGALLDVELQRDSPDRLNSALVAGELDISPISLAEYLRHADELLLLPGIAVGSNGPVLSVNLFSKESPAQLDGRPVALGSTSRTGVLLAQLVLAGVFGAEPHYERRTTDLGQMLADADAAVLIGDPALRAFYQADQLGLQVTDLGQAWKQWTGLPMVFAVWAVRKDFAEAFPGQVKDVYEAFQRAKELGLAELVEVAEAASRWGTFDSATLANYFRTLDFSLGEQQISGLREFARRAADRGAVPALPADGPAFVAL